MKPATVLVARPAAEPQQVDPLTPPLYATTTFVFDSAEEVRAYNEGRSAKYLYSRYANPTVVAVEQTLAKAEGAEQALLFASGQAATSAAILALAQAGDEIVCSAAAYGGTLHLLGSLLPRLGITTRFVGLDALRDPAPVLTARTRLVWFESPINPTLRCVDIRRLADACRAHDVVSVIDSTFASPVNQQPLSLGVDVVMHSATKYLNGHSDVTAGVLAGSARLLAPMERVRRMFGGIADPHAAHALGRGLKTLAVRVERQNATAGAIARWLAADARVQTVSYPGLPSHPDHEIARGQMRGFGGMLCLDVGSYERAARFFDRLRVFHRAASLGGVESLCSLPVLTSQWGHSEEALREAGVTPGMARLSVGLEDPEDLIADLDQALG
jgi:cystathionine beta-lyase/cystathionine gamma-synthase